MAKSNSTRPSKHLSWNELSCHDINKTPYPYRWRNNRAIQLAEVFEMIRHKCGDKPIKILSAYRTPEHNTKIGGVKYSQHVQGRALDLKTPKGMTSTRFFNTILELSRNTSIKGLGLYKTFVHVDIRPNEKLITWTRI